MNFLHSNFPPLKTNFQTFSEKFDELLFTSDKVQIASGYITADSLVELNRIIALNHRPKIDLVIGMHYFEGFTKKEYNAAIDFTNYLIENNMGCIYISTAFKYHGKLYSFLFNDTPSVGIIGSNNLNSITEYSRTYESSIAIEETDASKQLNEFINNLISISKPLLKCEITKFKENNPLLKDHDGVERIEGFEVSKISLTSTKFKIPLKAGDEHTKSNLNVFFGKGREDKRGLIKPRHWYEIELIVPSEITSKIGYPGNKSPNIFHVITDDGWKFQCKVSGDYNKNFRSEGDLKILGKWIKGRLENAGVLKVGDYVTNKTLSDYGRSDFDLIRTEQKDLWFLNFGA
jgi:hypothetical protein